MNPAHHASSTSSAAIAHNLKQLSHLSDGLAGLIDLLHQQNTEQMVSIAHLLTPMHREWVRLLDEITDLTQGVTR